MGDREVYLEDENVCDICGESPAYDFYGDFVCERCTKDPLIQARRSEIIAAFKKCYESDNLALSNEDAADAVDRLIELLYDTEWIE